MWALTWLPRPRVKRPWLSLASVQALIAVTVGLLFHGAMYGPQAACVSEQFSVPLRSTGSSLAYTIAGVFGGAIAPLLFTYLLDATGGWPAILGYIAVVGVLTVIGLLLGRNPDSAEEEHYREMAESATPATGSAT